MSEEKELTQKEEELLSKCIDQIKETGSIQERLSEEEYKLIRWAILQMVSAMIHSNFVAAVTLEKAVKKYKVQ